MTIEILIARWVSILWLVCGISHVLYPRLWTALLMPLRDRETGGLVLAGMSLPIGLVIILGHNVWAWDLALIVTLAGWMTTFKSVIYLLVPKAHVLVLGGRRQRSVKREIAGFRAIGVIMIVLGGLTAWDSFFVR